MREEEQRKRGAQRELRREEASAQMSNDRTQQREAAAGGTPIRRSELRPSCLQVAVTWLRLLVLVWNALSVVGRSWVGGVRVRRGEERRVAAAAIEARGEEGRAAAEADHELRLPHSSSQANASAPAAAAILDASLAIQRVNSQTSNTYNKAVEASSYE